MTLEKQLKREPAMRYLQQWYESLEAEPGSYPEILVDLQPGSDGSITVEVFERSFSDQERWSSIDPPTDYQTIVDVNAPLGDGSTDTSLAPT